LPYSVNNVADFVGKSKDDAVEKLKGDAEKAEVKAENEAKLRP